MAFVYCDDCDWQQDDFWHKTYNPFENLNEYIDLFLSHPEWIGFDSMHARELGLISRFKMVDQKPVCQSFGKGGGGKAVMCFKELRSNCDRNNDDPCLVKETEVLSASLLLFETKRAIINICNMYWATDEQWNADPDKWKCPHCGGEIHVD